MNLIRTQNLCVGFGLSHVLDNINFEISKGEIVTIVGPNGSGKSTLIRAILRLLCPTSGRVEYKAALRIGYVPQRLMIDATLPLTVERFLSLPVRRNSDDIRRVTVSVGAPGLEDHQMGALSGGQFQRILLARALLSKPEILILDEPTQGLDQQGIATFYTLIEKVRTEMGCAVLLVSHDLHVVMSASDRVICLNRHICCEGSPQVVSAAPEYRAMFGIGTSGALALYRHVHDHSHDQSDGHLHDQDNAKTDEKIV